MLLDCGIGKSLFVKVAYVGGKNALFDFVRTDQKKKKVHKEEEEKGDRRGQILEKSRGTHTT